MRNWMRNWTRNADGSSSRPYLCGHVRTIGRPGCDNCRIDHVVVHVLSRNLCRARLPGKGLVRAGDGLGVCEEAGIPVTTQKK